MSTTSNLMGSLTPTVRNCKNLSPDDQPPSLVTTMPSDSATSSSFCIRRSTHSSDLMKDFGLMLQDEEFVDVTLMCEDGSINAHKLFLSSYSPYFKSVFARLAASANKSTYPVIVLKDLPFSDLKAIIDFIYRGEITVPQPQWKSLVKSAESLKIRGLVGLRDPRPSSVEVKGHGKKIRKRRKKNTSNLKQTNNEQSYDCSSEASVSLTDARTSCDSDSVSDGDREYDSSTHITTVHGDERNSVSTLGEVEPSNLMEQSMIISGDASGNTSPVHRNNLNNTPNPSVNDHHCSGLVSPLESLNDPMNHHNISSSLGNMLSFDQNSMHHPVAGPSSGHSSLSRPQGDVRAFTPSTGSRTLVNCLPMDLHHSHLSALHSNSLSHEGNHSSVIGNHGSSCSSSPHPMSLSHDLIRRSRYQCPICLKAFSEKGNMKRHTQIHSQQRHRYMCDLCSKCFSWKDNFNRHRRTHH